MTTEKELSFWNKYGVYIIGGSGLVFIGIGASIAYAGRKARQAAIQPIPQQPAPMQQPSQSQMPQQQIPVQPLEVQPAPPVQQPVVQPQPVPQQQPTQQQPVQQQAPRLLTQPQIQALSQQQAQTLYWDLRERAQNTQLANQYRDSVLSHWNHLIRDRLEPIYGRYYYLASLIEKGAGDIIERNTECVLEEAKRVAENNQSLSQRWSNLRYNAMVSLGSAAQPLEDSAQRLTWTFYEAEEILKAGGASQVDVAHILKDYSANIWNYYLDNPEKARRAYNIVTGVSTEQTCPEQPPTPPFQQ